jgi:uncharacterized protein YbjT (DUF2867 family)
MNHKKILVIGATGALGFQITKALIDKGVSVRAMVRETSNRFRLEKLGVTDFVVGDLMNPESLVKVFASLPVVDAVVASAAGYTSHTKGDTAQTDRVGYKNLVDAVKSAGVPRFVLISILECDKATAVPHFHNKYIIEKYLQEVGQPYIALRAGAFLDQSKDLVLEGLPKGKFMSLIPGVKKGMIYTPDLARYAAIAAVDLPAQKLNRVVDVGWNKPVNDQELAEAFSEVLGKPIVEKAIFPGFAVNVLMPILSQFVEQAKDINEMVKWIKTGQYRTKNTQDQMEFFGEVPTVKEVVTRYSKDRGLI